MAARTDMIPTTTATTAATTARAGRAAPAVPPAVSVIAKATPLGTAVLPGHAPHPSTNCQKQ
jgi:hypothetical protein